jgi:hypothetical protein
LASQPARASDRPVTYNVQDKALKPGAPVRLLEEKARRAGENDVDIAE